jgi:hypothetical protein
VRWWHIPNGRFKKTKASVLIPKRLSAPTQPATLVVELNFLTSTWSRAGVSIEVA